MKTIHRLLALYTTIIVLLVIFFSFVIVTEHPDPSEIASMVISIAMFSLIPFGIIFLIWRHHKH